MCERKETRRGEVTGKMRKMLALVLFLVVFGLMTVSVSAETTPVMVKRVKDVCFIKVRGDKHAQLFQLNYVNLSPSPQNVLIRVQVSWGEVSTSVTLEPRWSMVITMSGSSGALMNFWVTVDGTLVLEDSIAIPPKK